MARSTKAEREEQARREAAKAAEKEALEEIGKRIAQARKEAGVTQRQAGDHLGITETMVSNIERGVYSPYKYLSKLEKLLGRDREWFLHGNDGNEPTPEIADTLKEILEKLDTLTRLVEGKKK